VVEFEPGQETAEGVALALAVVDEDVEAVLLLVDDEDVAGLLLELLEADWLEEVDKDELDASVLDGVTDEELALALVIIDDEVAERLLLGLPEPDRLKDVGEEELADVLDGVADEEDVLRKS
jgi:hypothetical protein